jgi:FtsP/CotA-like multicopper oxidase with cupredoxin domain
MRSGLIVLATAVAVQCAVVIGLVIAAAVPHGAGAQTVRNYDLEITNTDIDYGGGNVWHAWTFNGQVPGPTLTIIEGEKLRVHVTNKTDLVHSFHTHLVGYDLASDGSQVNSITGVGAGAMIPPGGEYTYEFGSQKPGIYYYHCHSADGGFHITQHIHQGLYGAIIVKPRDPAPVRDEVIMMGEMGHDTEGDSVPQFIMNGMGLPGGEHALEAAFTSGGIDAVVSQLNYTVPAIEATVGEDIHLHVINIGDQVHTFHAHDVEAISLEALGGRPWPADVVPLLPGAADTVSLKFTQPGLWLFHCHVVNHADAGMIGLFIIDERGAPKVLPGDRQEPIRFGVSPGTVPTRAPPTETPTGGPAPSSSLHLSMSEWKIREAAGGAIPPVAAGPVEVDAHNIGSSPHQLVVIKTDTDPVDLPLDESGTAVDLEAAGQVIGTISPIAAGTTEGGTFSLDGGNYVLICNIPTHYGLGMHARLVVQ